MTETLSHVALRPLNGPEASAGYRPFEGVSLSLSARGTLVIHAPELCVSDLETNDVARLYDDGTFMIVGRADNVVNSGGRKNPDRGGRALAEGAYRRAFCFDFRAGPAVGRGFGVVVGT